jgi:hypothetical protein
MKYLTLILVFSFLLAACAKKEAQTDKKVFTVKVTDNKAEQRVDVTVNGQPFTSYIYSDKIETLKKPTLYPVMTAKGTEVTRGYPLNPRAGERNDHPHHAGYWLTYGDVNGLDFWGNSSAIPKSRAEEMGHIKTTSIKSLKSGDGQGVLEITADWLNNANKPILKEDTKFIFHAAENKRCIDRITTLTAQDAAVHFNDTKEGMLGIRVAHELEHPSDKPVKLSDAKGNITVIEPENQNTSGHYLNSEGVEGLDTWGKRAKWNTLYGNIKGEDIALAIFDHPDNVGYPTYWHSRGYGLFAANPFGAKTFTKGAQEMNFKLDPGQSITLKYRMVIIDGKPSKEDMEKAWQKWAATK